MNRSKPLKARTGLTTRTPLKAGAGLKRGARLAPVSSKRRAENRERLAMVAELWPERPQCERPGCGSLADDVHEPLTRGRGGSITDKDNARALCRPCHDEITFSPESELDWAYECGLLIHSWAALSENGPDAA